MNTATPVKMSPGKSTYLIRKINSLEKISTNMYVTDLKTKVQTCKFTDLKESLILDCIIRGTICDKTCARLLKKSRMDTGVLVVVHRIMPIKRSSAVSDVSWLDISGDVGVEYHIYHIDFFMAQLSYIGFVVIHLYDVFEQ